MSVGISKLLPVVVVALLSACGGGGGGNDGASNNQNTNQSTNGGLGGGTASAYTVGPAVPLAVVADGRMVLQATINATGSNSGVLPGLLVWDPVTKAVLKGVKLSLSTADLVTLVGAGATATNTSASIQGARSSTDGGLILSMDIFGPNQSPTTSAGKAHVYVKLDANLTVQWIRAYASFQDWGGIEARSDGYVSSNGLRFDLNGNLTTALSAAAIPYFSQLLGSGSALLFSGSVIADANGTYKEYAGESCFGNAAVLTADGGAIVAGFSTVSKYPALCKTDAAGAPVAAVALDYAAPGGAWGGFNSLVALQGSYYAVSPNSVNDVAVPSYSEWALCKFAADLTLDHCVVSTDKSGFGHSVIGLLADSNTGRLYVSTYGSSPFAVLDAGLNLLPGSSHTIAPLATVATKRVITASATQTASVTDRLAQVNALQVTVTPTRQEMVTSSMALPANLTTLLQ